MKEKIITAFQDNHRDLLISKKTGQFEDVLYNTGYETAMSFVLGLMGISKEEALNMKEVKEDLTMMYIVTAIREIDDTTNVEVAGIFDTSEKAYEAQRIVSDWMEQNEYNNYEVFVQPTNVNHISWYDIKKDI